MGNGNIAFLMECCGGGDKCWAVVCGAGARPDELSIVLFDDEHAIDTVVGMVDDGKCSAMTPGNFYLKRCLVDRNDK